MIENDEDKARTAGALAPEEKASISKYAAVVPTYALDIWLNLRQIAEARLSSNIYELGDACTRAENVHGLLVPELRRHIEKPSEVVSARIKDEKGSKWGYKATLGRTRWEVEHKTASLRLQQIAAGERVVKIYKAYLLEFCTRVIDLLSEANILLPQDYRFNPVTDEGAGGPPEKWKPDQ